MLYPALDPFAFAPADLLDRWADDLVGVGDPSAWRTFLGALAMDHVDEGIIAILANANEIVSNLDRPPRRDGAFRCRGAGARRRRTEGAIGFDTQKALLDAVASWMPADAKICLIGDLYNTADLISLCQGRGGSYRLRLEGGADLGALPVGRVVCNRRCRGGQVCARALRLFVVQGLNANSKIADWDALRLNDVIVAPPNSASPSMDGVALPPSDFFDLVLVDEAHHSPAHPPRAPAWH